MIGCYIDYIIAVFFFTGNENVVAVRLFSRQMAPLIRCSYEAPTLNCRRENIRMRTAALRCSKRKRQ